MEARLALRSEVEALAAIERGSASEGESASAEWVAGRLRDVGASDVRLDRFRYQATFAWAHAAHSATGVAAALGGSAPLALLAAASFQLEFGGRVQLLRELLPAGTGTNVVARIPARGATRRTLVLVAHHDAARTGLVWDERFARIAWRKAADTGRMESFAGLPMAALGLVAAGSLLHRRSLRIAGGAVLALQTALMAEVARGPVVPGANDNATGVAAVIELVRRYAVEPFEDVDVVALAPGCEESGMGGMAAWLRAGGRALDPARTFVLGLDTIGSGEPVVLDSEGPPLAERYRDEDIAWVERGAATAGLPKPRRFRIAGWTDPILAVHAGLPAASIVSVADDGGFPNYHRPTDVPESVDWDCVERTVRIAAGTAEAWVSGSAP